MTPFSKLAHELGPLVEKASASLSILGMDEDMSIKPSPTRWSKKEILGHLIDSACNNHQRFVRAALDGSLTFPSYEQEGWARLQCYELASWDNLLILWTTYNFHLAFMLRHLPATAASNQCRIGDGEPVTLLWLVEDYIRHMRHHLKQMLPDDPVKDPKIKFPRLRT